MRANSYTLPKRPAVLSVLFASSVLVTVQSASGQSAAVQPADETSTVTVIGVAPVPGTSIPVDVVPWNVQTFDIPRIADGRHTDVIANLLASQSASISINNEQGSPYQPDLSYRGFRASPISGIAEGIAVYQNGTRLNEAFGDNVNWDLIPEFAVARVTLQSNDPLFGLNALGGALTLDMKDGLNFEGTAAELSAGTFDNITGHAEAGRRFGDFGLYVGIGEVHDDGFRYHSPTRLAQAYADIAYERNRLTLHLSFTGARNTIDAVGPTPVELLAADPKAVFTYPQAIANRLSMVQTRGTYQASEHLSVTGQAFFRRFTQHLMDGNTTDVTRCENERDQLCLEGDSLYPNDALYGENGAPAPASVLPDGATPGEIDFTRTRTTSVGGALQAILTAPFGEHTNKLVVGASIDHGSTRYDAYGELGALKDDLSVVGSGVVIDQGLNPTASPPIEEPVHVGADHRYIGVYAIDVFGVSQKLFLTLSGRWNDAQVTLHDLTGGTLTSDHSYSHFNSGLGVAYKVAGSVMGYAGFSEANRAPTAGELSCADPASPCLLDAFLVSDPELKQVVSHNVELGMRGRIATARGGSLTWNIDAYRTNVRDDILLLATQINGFGYFQNSGTTRHQGVDVALGYRDRRWRASATYGYVDVTFRNPQTISSNSPAADDDGVIQVAPGNHIPGEPQHRMTFSLDYDASRRWTIGGDLRWQTDQYLIGDESNQEPKLPGFATFSVHSYFALTSRVGLFASIDNLFDRRYYTYGSFTELAGLPPQFALSNPRTYSPSQGRSVAIGARVRFG